MLNRKLKCQPWAVKQMLTVAYPAGQSYSYLKKACVQVFDVADIKLDDPANKTQAVYGILSEDKQQVEVFASDLPENTILEVVKGGYVSKDGKVRLMKTKNSWKIRK